MSRSQLSVCFAASAGVLLAQTAPVAYTVVQTNAMFGQPIEQTIYRDGSKALVQQNNTRTLYNLQSGVSQSWDVTQDGCSNGRFSGDWGDPFAMSAEVAKQNPKEAGAETIGGIPTKVLEAAVPGAKLKVWQDPKTGLVIRAQMTPPSGPAQTVIDVRQFKVGAPPASTFALPAGCASAAPPPPTEAERIASATGGNAADFASAIMPPPSPSPNSCTVQVRMLRAGSMQPIANGFQIAVDTTYNVDHAPHYNIGISTDGKATFSGGGLRELTGELRNGVLRLENPPSYFYLEAYFGKAGSSGGLIYRQCFGPQTTLLLVVKNPSRLSDGADWLWVKSGKYAIQ
jgi:hypothetical protein